MSKEYLEAWNFIKEQMQNFTFSHLVAKMVENADIVDNALQRLESIDNANLSEALQVLLKAKQERLIFYGRLLDNDKIFFETLEPTLLKAQEQENVIRLIFEKNVDIWLLKSCLTVELYNFSITKMDNCNVFNLTKEEFDLLKRYYNKNKR